MPDNKVSEVAVKLFLRTYCVQAGIALDGSAMSKPEPIRVKLLRPKPPTGTAHAVARMIKEAQAKRRVTLTWDGMRRGTVTKVGAEVSEVQWDHCPKVRYYYNNEHLRELK